MGFGGALIWTGIARNLKSKYPDKKVVFSYRYRGSLTDYIFRRPRQEPTNPDHIIYKHNEDIECVSDHITWILKKWLYRQDNIIIVDMENPVYFYYEKDTAERIFYKTGRHAIQIACDVHNIPNAKLQPKIKLSEKENERANRLLKSHNLLPNQYICIEPHAKKEFTPNKAWFWENWQDLVNHINQYISDNHIFCKLVQIGVETDRVLNGVVDLTGKSTFRQTAHILKNAITLLSYMGGLVHLSKAVGKKNIVIISAWEPLELASYPDDINLYTDIDCKNCGLKIPCPINRKCMAAITVQQVYEVVKSVLKAFINNK